MAAFIEQWPYNLNFTLKWFNVNTVGSTPIQIFLNTVFVATISAILGTIVAILTAYVTQRGIGNNKIRKFLDWIGILPLAIPSLVIGLSYLLFFNRAMNPLKVIYESFAIMIFANIMHFFNMPYMTIKGSMKKIDSEYENVSETIGVLWYKVFNSVILPLSKPAIIESFQYYFLNSMMTISALIFLYTTKTKVAAVEMVATYDEGYIASTVAIAVMILITNMIVKYGIELYKFKDRNDKKEKEMDIFRTLQVINEDDGLSQRKMAEKVGISVGKMNYIIKDCIKNQWINKIEENKRIKYEVTEKGFELLRENIGNIKEDRILISKDSLEKVDTAVILAAGERKDFEISPAGLPIGNSTVIKETIRKLKLNGITKIIVVVGHGKDVIKQSLKNESGICFVESENYNESGSMGSLALASQYIEGDFILVEGDVVFEKRAIEALIKSEKRECVLITEVSGSGDEEFIQMKEDFLFKLGKDVHQFNRIDGEIIGILKISYKLFELMMKEYKENINPLLNYDYILLDVARDFKVSCLRIDDLLWSEIDNAKQYARAIKIAEKINII